MTAADEFEARVRRELQAVATAAFNPSARYVTERMNAATDAIKQAAERWGLAEYGVTADRRAELKAALGNGRGPGVVVHFQDDFLVPACHKHNAADPVLTLSRQHVTCASCKRTRAWKEGA